MIVILAYSDYSSSGFPPNELVKKIGNAKDTHLSALSEDGFHLLFMAQNRQMVFG
jgi:hypothetical protein